MKEQVKTYLNRYVVFSDSEIDEICNLTFAIAQLNTWTRLVRTFKINAGHYEVKK